MAGSSFEFDMSALTKAVEGLAGRMDLQPLAEKIGEALVSSTQDHFRDAEAPDGTAWPVSQRAAKEGGKTLQKTGDLKNSITSEASPTMVVVGVDRSKMGSNKEYARIHQFGGKAGRGRKVTIPKRSYLGISKENLKEIRAMMREYLRGK